MFPNRHRNRNRSRRNVAFVPAAEGLPARVAPSGLPGSDTPVDPGDWTTQPREWGDGGAEGSWGPDQPLTGPNTGATTKTVNG
jgi:hypothetical protein